MNMGWIAKFGITLLCAGLVCAPASSAAPIPLRTDSNPSVVTYSKTFGVSESVSKLRLAKTLEAGRIEASMERKSPESFAGLYVEHEPQFRIVVMFTGDAKALLAQYTRDPVYVARQAPRSLELLLAVQDEADSQLSKENIRFESGIDIKTSEVIISVRDVAAARKALSKLLRVANFITVRQIHNFIELTSIRGGNRLSGNTMSCTTGFNVVDATLELGITTAGHCDNTATYTSPSTQLVYQGELDAGGHDIQWHKEQQTDTPQPQTNTITLINGPSPSVDITGTISSSLTPVGAPICKSGISGHYLCGTIQDKNSHSNYNNVIGSYVRATSNTGAAMSVEGDSGGPVFAGNSAIGTIHGRGGAGEATHNDLFYMPIERVLDLGVSVLTASFDITAISPESGPYYQEIPIEVNYKGIPKLPITMHIETLSCNSLPCGSWEFTFPEVGSPSPYRYSWACNPLPEQIFDPQPSSNVLRTRFVDASGISTSGVNHIVNCIGR